MLVKSKIKILFSFFNLLSHSINYRHDGSKYVCSCRKKSKDKECEAPPPVPPSPCEGTYSTVEECSGVVAVACLEQSVAPTVDAAAAATAAEEDESGIMVNCDLYSGSTDEPATVTKNADADISPYACFYGAPKQPVLRVGWLDKLSPQG